jgi:hypothetical protein
LLSSVAFRGCGRGRDIGKEYTVIWRRGYLTLLQVFKKFPLDLPIPEEPCGQHTKETNKTRTKETKNKKTKQWECTGDTIAEAFADVASVYEELLLSLNHVHITTSSTQQAHPVYHHNHQHYSDTSHFVLCSPQPMTCGREETPNFLQ